MGSLEIRAEAEETRKAVVGALWMVVGYFVVTFGAAAIHAFFN